MKKIETDISEELATETERPSFARRLKDLIEYHQKNHPETLGRLKLIESESKVSKGMLSRYTGANAHVPGFDVVANIAYTFKININYFLRTESPEEYYELQHNKIAESAFYELTDQEQKMFKKLIAGWKIQSYQEKEQEKKEKAKEEARLS